MNTALKPTIKTRLKGVFPPMITPFKTNGKVDYAAFESNILKWNNEALAGYTALGSNSETALLNDKEKKELIKLTISCADPRKIIIVGTGTESTVQTQRNTGIAAECGAHYALVLTPCFYGDRMGDTELINHYTAVADQSPIPVLLYNVPKYTHVAISVRAVKVLAQHENIAGMKDSTGDITRMAAIQNAVPSDFNLIIGTASAWFPGLALNLSAGIMALANCYPRECIMVQELFSKGKIDEARKLYNKLLPLNTAVTVTYGVAGLKYLASLLGYSAGTVRSPLLPLSEKEQAEICMLIDNSGPE